MTQFITKLASGLSVLALMAAAVPGTVFAATYTIDAPSSVTIAKSSLIDANNGVAENSEDVQAIASEANSIEMILVGNGDTTDPNGYSNVRINATEVDGPGQVQLWIKEDSSGNWYDTAITGWGPGSGFPITADYNEGVTVVAVADTAGEYTLSYSVVDVTSGDPVASGSTELTVTASAVVNIQNFNTHSGADYKGVNVGFDVTDVTEFTEVTVELRDANDVTIVTNIGDLEMLNGEIVNGEAVLSTPFMTQNLEYGEEAYWTLGEWESYEKPHAVVVTVNGTEKVHSPLTEPNGWTWETLIPAVAPTNFNTVDNAGYKGINVGFNISNISAFTEVTVELQDADENTLVVNTGVIEQLNELLADGVLGYSTPFITYDLGYAASEIYWNFGEWQSDALPAFAIITVNGVEATNSSLSVQQDWATIAPVVEEEETRSRGRSGGSRRAVDTAPAGEVLGAQTGPDSQGQVLGASSYNFTRDLTIGSSGDDVTALQAMLIASGDLAIAAPTGYFGELTRAALGKWQARHGVAPAAGYFGPITRAAIAAMGTPAPTMTDAARAAAIAELLEKVAELQEKLDEMNEDEA